MLGLPTWVLRRSIGAWLTNMGFEEVYWLTNMGFKEVYWLTNMGCKEVYWCLSYQHGL